MQHGNAQPVEEEATAKGAEVARSELVLSGNRVKSLLDSLLAWSRSRMDGSAHGLYVRDAAGALEWCAGAGNMDREVADPLALAFCRDPEAPAPAGCSPCR